MIEALIRKGKIAIRLVLVLSVLTGLLYPGVITILAQSLFNWEANGSPIQKQGMVIGSMLIGQPFTDKDYFWGRPSATTPFEYNAALSAGGNLAQHNPLLLKRVEERVKTLRAEDHHGTLLIPVDLVTTSGSGLDPDISPAAALYQVPRIAKATRLSEAVLQELIQRVTEPRTLGLLGEPHVNVLKLNRALDDLRNS